jgi:phage terminase large subunit GpA-like protein
VIFEDLGFRYYGPIDGHDTALLARTFTREDGAQMAIHRACVDSGGHRTDEVYDFTAPRLPRVVAIKGRGGSGYPLVDTKPSIVGQRRSLIHHVGADAAKDALLSRLVLTEPGPGYCHFPSSREAGYDTDYFLGLTSERKKQALRNGRRVYVWTQHYKRNEPLDCRCYATAALELAIGLDGVRLDERPKPKAPPAAEERPATIATTTAPPRRRVLSRGVTL